MEKLGRSRFTRRFQNRLEGPAACDVVRRPNTDGHTSSSSIVDGDDEDDEDDEDDAG